MKKFLIIRFSSMGDIVLTTPVIRSLKKAFPKSEIHFLTKAGFAPLLQHNPHISHIHLLEDDLRSNIKSLKQVEFDHVFDLHHNLRTLRVKLGLRKPSTSFFKANANKFLLTKQMFRNWANPITHVVTRYGKTLSGIDKTLDQDGLELFLPDGLEAEAKSMIVKKLTAVDQPFAVVLGAKFATKRWPTDYFITLHNKLGKPVVLLGGADAREDADTLIAGLNIPFFDTVGKYDLLTSAAIMKNCKAVITHDTGFMHIAAAFRMKVYSIWGNTVPALGMTPYKTDFQVIETTGLSCRPCSKIGYDACPEGHFRCMKDILPDRVLKEIQT